MPDFNQLVRPQTSPIARATAMAELQGLMQRNKGQQLDNQVAEQNVAERKILTDAYGQSGGDLDKFAAAVRGKVSPQTQATIEQSALLRKQEVAKLSKEQRDTAAAQNGLIGQHLNAIMQAPPEQRESAYQQSRQVLGAQGIALPEQYPGDEWAQHGAISSLGLERQLEEAETHRHNLAGEANAGQSDFEQAFKRDNGRPPTVQELLKFKREMAVAGTGIQPGTWQVQRDEDGNAVLFNSKTAEVKPAPPGLVPKGEKPTADEQRRADLAGNLKENLDALEDIVSRRPELFGPVAGRITGARQAFGTSDADVAALETLQHQIGMAQISAHGMRSAHGIAAAADSIVNSFKNSPDAVKGAIEAARKSVTTFEQDVQRAHHHTAATGDFHVTAPNGKTYHFKSQADADGFKAKAGIK